MWPAFQQKFKFSIEYISSSFFLHFMLAFHNPRQFQFRIPKKIHEKKRLVELGNWFTMFFFLGLFCSFIVMVQRMCRHARWAHKKTATIYLNKLNMQKLHRYCVTFIRSVFCNFLAASLLDYGVHCTRFIIYYCCCCNL